MGLALTGYSMPIFWWGLILVLVMSNTLHLTPVSGRVDLIKFYYQPVTGFMLIDSLLSGQKGAFMDAVRHLILPMIVLGTVPLAVIARMTRSSMLEVLEEDYVRTARAKGLSWTRIVGVHALRNALIPVVTVIGLQVGGAARRRGADRDDLLLAGRGQVADRIDQPPRLSGAAGRHHADRHHRHRRQPVHRHALWPHQPEDPPCQVTPRLPATATAPAPPGPIRAFWRAFRENRGAVLGLAVVSFILFVAIFANVLAPYSPIEQFRGFSKLPPFWVEGSDPQFILGTDAVGRDMLSRLMYGARVSLFIGLSVMVVSMVVGVALGLAAAFFGGIVDVIIIRVMDLIMAIPSLVLAILIIAIIGPNLTNTIVAVTIVGLPRYVRLVRASAMTELTKDYVTAAKVSGVGKFRLMTVTVLPNCLAPLIVQAALGLSDAILEAAGLGFLGLGAQPPTPEWGAMLADTRDLILSHPWVMAFPGLAILITVLAINLMGDGLRDALDPRLRRS